MTKFAKKSLALSAAVASVLAGGSAYAAAPASEPSAAELMEQIKALQSKVAEMEKSQVAATAPTGAAVDATVESVLRDAERRSALFQDSALLAGHDGKKFYLRSADDSFSLNPGVQMQFRYVYNWADEAQGDGDANSADGFEIRRLKLEFGGHAFTKDLKYFFSWQANRNGGGVSLENAWVSYKFADDLGFRAGQFKESTFHEEITSSKRQLAADRSIVNELLGGGLTDYVQGVSLLYGMMDKDNPVNAEIGVTDGINSDNTGALASRDWGVFGRVDFRASGDWKNYADFTAMGTKEDLLVIGGGGGITQVGDSDFYYGTVDLQWENAGGLGVYLAGLVNHSTAGDDTDDTTNFGVVGQVGYLLPDSNVEVFGRGSIVLFDEDITLGTEEEDTLIEITGGINYYLGDGGKYGHSAKVTLDVGYLPNGAVGDSGLGIVESGEDQFYVRGQFQLLL